MSTSGEVLAEKLAEVQEFLVSENELGNLKNFRTVLDTILPIMNLARAEARTFTSQEQLNIDTILNDAIAAAKDSLTPSQIQEIDDITTTVAYSDAVTAFKGTEYEAPKEYEIYNHGIDAPKGTQNPPKGLLVYKGIAEGLHPDVTIADNGDLQEIIFYANASIDAITGATTYTTPVFKVLASYTRGVDGNYESRQKTWQAYFTDGTLDTDNDVVKPKTYPQHERMNKTKKARRNKINKIKQSVYSSMLALGTMTLAEAKLSGQNFIDSVKDELYSFEESTHDAIITAINNADAVTYPWIDTVLQNDTRTCRQYIIDILEA